MDNRRVFGISFAKLHPLYVAKAGNKGRTRDEVDQVIRWLTGYDRPGLEAVLSGTVTLERFFAEAPAMNPAREQVTGVVCGVRVEEIADPLMREIRRMDKLVDELAKGRPMERILRQGAGK